MKIRKILCKILGHNMKRYEGMGILPSLSPKVIRRTVFICGRCGLRQQFDAVLADYDLKQGINIWGSAGICYGCKHKSCEMRPVNVKKVDGNTLYILGASFAYEHCPISNFEIREDLKEEYKETLKNWRDTLISLPWEPFLLELAQRYHACTLKKSRSENTRR